MVQAVKPKFPADDLSVCERFTVDSEVMKLNAEIESLKAEVADLKGLLEQANIDISGFYREFSTTLKRISKLEGSKRSRGTEENLDRLAEEMKNRGVPGVTFQVAASILDLDRSTISKMTARLKEDGRFRVEIHGRKKIIRFS